MVENASDFRRGDVHPSTVFMGACPGRQEEIDGRPFAGSAGANLRIMLETLSAEMVEHFPSSVMEDYSLLNAHDLPRYRGREGYDGRTTPPRGDVLEDGNLGRLRERLEAVDASKVIYLGQAAEYAHSALPGLVGGISFFRLGHPSPLAWNPRKEYGGLSKREKLARWAVDSWVQL